MKLTDRLIDTLEPPPKGNRRVPDNEVKGFNGQVTAAGERGFVLRYRIRGRARLYTIGSRSVWSTVAARNRARELRRLVDQGIDPHEQEARARDEAMTVGEFWSKIYEPLHVPSLRPSSQRNVRSMWARDILPRIGRLPVKDVDQADVAALHREVSKRAAIRANRCRATISSLMSWAESPHVLETGERIPPLRSVGSNPCRRVRRNREEKRERFLSPAEVARLIAVLDRRRSIPREQPSADLVRWLLLTGARFGEAAKAEWPQIDFAARAWTKPSTNVKTGKAHTIPLSGPALQLLMDIRARSTSRLLFPGQDGRPIRNLHHYWNIFLQLAGIEGLRPHDLRHTHASVLASGGASLLLIGQLLGHERAETSKRYSHLVDSVQREAVERAAAAITGGESAEIVPMRQRR